MIPSEVTAEQQQRWADYVDAVVSPTPLPLDSPGSLLTPQLGNNNQFMVNFADHVPHLPPRLWGYRHSAGEVWSLPDPEAYWLCGGQENPVSQLAIPRERNQQDAADESGLLALPRDART